jgi:non-ribosomal peptide synthetase component F
VRVAVPVDVRGEARFAAVVGYFVNPVVVQTSLDPSASFQGFATQVRRAMDDARRNADLPFPLLVERLSGGSGRQGRPLAQAMFVHHAPPDVDSEAVLGAAVEDEQARIGLGEVILEPLPLDIGVAQFELTLATGVCADGGLILRWTYDTDLFDETTVVLVAQAFEQLLRDGVATPERALSEMLAGLPVPEPPTVASMPESAGRATNRVAPRDEIEAALAAIWAEVLGRSEVGVRDDFFELGGQSLQAMRLLGLTRQAFRTELSLEQFFECTTVERLACALVAAERQAGDTLAAARTFRSRAVARSGETQ